VLQQGRDIRLIYPGFAAVFASAGPAVRDPCPACVCAARPEGR